MLIFPDPSVSTEYTDPNGSVWEFNGTGWVRQCDCDGSGGDGVEEPTDPDFDKVYTLINADDQPDGSQSLVDLSNNNSITATNGARITTSDFKYGTGSIDLNSNSGWLALSNVSDAPQGRDDCTVECWVKLGSSSTDYQYIYTTGYNIQIVIHQKKISVYLANSGGHYFVQLHAPNEVPIGSWFHCAIQWSSDPTRFVQINIDGVPVASMGFTDAIAAPSSSLIGAYEGGAYPIQGWIDDFRITKGLRYSTNGAFDPPDKLPTKPAIKLGGVAEVEVPEEPLFRGDNDADLPPATYNDSEPLGDDE
jgi:hypothetical protein